ncbi:MAG TPA: glycosyltransferase family A protein [Myxococcota bacterium]|nr:glycosyltransferase family A protein [Myxococcota bacterium]
MALETPRVSVVTPVYNGERFLGQCIESVLRQTYANWDYTIVNNCSTDRTLEIARDYAARDPRIRVRCNDKFVRVIENYNNAVRQISPESKYCKVVAADDRLMPECLEKMVGLAEAHPSAAIVGAYGMCGAERPRLVWQGVPFPNELIRGRDACRSMLLGGPYVFGTPTSLLMRSELVRSRPTFYNEANLQADVEVCLELLQDHDFGFVHQVLTFQGVRDDSLTSFSDEWGTNLPWVVTSLTKFGPRYLNEQEIALRLRNHLEGYYWYLGRQVFARRGRAFWSFHREKLAAAGHPLSRLRVARCAAGVAADAILNPKRSLGAARQWLQARARERSSRPR